jgi:glycosyltransferase involved in cell wall biosynthesis
MLRTGALVPQAREADIVHVHGGEALALAIAMRARRVRTPLLATYHVAYREFARAHRPYRIEGRRFGGGWPNFRYRTLTCTAHRVMDRAMLWLADGLSFISRSSAKDLLGEAAARRAEIIYNSVPPLEAPPESADRGGNRILYVGNAGDRKRITVLPFVLRRIHEHRPDARLTIVGAERSEVPRVDRLFREFGLQEAVTWVGRLLSEEITRHYQRAALVIVPSASEGLPMVILEAFRAATPCVATQVSGHPEAVEHGRSGLLAGPDDPDAMARACLELLDDPELARRMGEEATTIVRERFSVDRQVRHYIELYGKLREAVT